MTKNELVDVITTPEVIGEFLSRGVEQVYPTAEEMFEDMRSGRRLTAYLGIDPTAPDLHVGHLSQLRRLRRLQDLGHNAVLLLGGFTARVGDPTDRSAARVRMTAEEVDANAQGYKQQAGKILDFDGPNAASLRDNNEWLETMDFAGVLELASEFTVQQLLDRDMFKQRIAEGKPLSVVETLYPLMQAYDSVALGVDIELGGSDQTFNMLMGSTLVKRMLGKQKYVVAGRLLEDPGGRKIGKTEGNMITLNDSPADMYHKTMLWGDTIVPLALELCSTLTMVEIEEISAKMKEGSLSGLDAKRFLARQLVQELHGQDQIDEAEEAYDRITGGSELDTESLIPASVTKGTGIIDVLVSTGLAPSRSQARRLLESSGVRINDQTIDESWTMSDDPEFKQVLQVGRRVHANFRLLNLANS